MQNTLPPLPFTFDALEPYIDSQTMQLHHGKHHQTYVDKLNAGLLLHPELPYTSVEQMLLNINKIPEDIRGIVRNHGGGHSNHSIFWTLLSPDQQEPSGMVQDVITKTFQSFEAFKEKFSLLATNHFGSGWVWLVKTAQGTYELKAYPNQDSPFMEGSTPLLGIDVWEHAYYLRYQNRRAEYIVAFWNIINWKEVDRRFASIDQAK